MNSTVGMQLNFLKRGWTSWKNNYRGKRDKVMKGQRSEEASGEFLSFLPLYLIKSVNLSKWIRYRIKIVMPFSFTGGRG